MDSFHCKGIVDGADIQQANLLFINVEKSEAQGGNNLPRRSASGKMFVGIARSWHLTVNDDCGIGKRILRGVMIDDDNINSFLRSIGDFLNIGNTAVYGNH